MLTLLVFSALLAYGFGKEVNEMAEVGEPRDCTCPQMYYFGSSGTIQSPNYPNQYCNNMKCYYYMQVPPGMAVQLTFQSFNTEVTLDTVTVFDAYKADDPLNTIATLSGNLSSIIPLYSAVNTMTVAFTTDNTQTASGFSATFTAVSNICGTTAISNQVTGTISSPNWGYMYPDNTYCLWTVTAPTGKYIQISFNPSSETESNADFITVYDNNNAIASYSGSVFQTLQTTSNILKVKFTSDGTVVDKGFTATFNVITPQPNCSCGSPYLVLNSPNSQMPFVSPNYGQGGYCANANCQTFLVVPQGYFAQLTFANFSLESSYDYLKLYNGVSGSLIESCTGNYCATAKSNTNTMTAVFTTDGSVNLAGYQAFLSASN